MLFAKRHFEANLDQHRIIQAIRAAETGTSGEIRIAIAPAFIGSIERRAARAFKRLGMTRTRHRNGVLVFVAPSRKQFRVLGDRAIHEIVGQTFWDQMAADLGNRFQKLEYTDGLIAVVEAVGSELARHFPAEQVNPDELPNDLAKG